MPAPLLDTLFGRGAVHTLDGEEHRVRKALFTCRARQRVVGCGEHTAMIRW
ncbi:hypothetical protein ACFVGN_30175 [Streptomyces sp. NPDC057757]|uniref:hypothetical protein n=1 Tax=Streptomyces sp. NPDC057757 TaxID=3346241 RepID=UPI003683F949